MAKKRKNEYSYLSPDRADKSAREKATVGLVRSWKRVKMDVSGVEYSEGMDEFDFLDLIGQKSPEALVAREAVKNGELAEAPCARCAIETCPGSMWECLLNMGEKELRLALGIKAEIVQISTVRFQKLCKR